MSASVNRNEGKLSITTHVLDTSRGRPGDGLPVCLYKFENDKWILLKERCIISYIFFLYTYFISFCRIL